MDINNYNSCVQNWTDALFRFAKKHTGNTEDARDIVQNCFEILWQKKKEVIPGKEKAFLFQVAYHHSIDHFRKQKRMSFPERMPEGRSTTTGNQDLKRQLDKALDTLDEQTRALVLLKDYEGYKYEEIAVITGLTATQVKVYLHRARKKLKEYLVKIENLI